METKKITIIGAGLIGGSLAKAFVCHDKFEVTCVDNDIKNIELASIDGVIVKDICYISEAVCDADLIFICTPVMEILDIVRRISSFMKKGSIITDVGSTKRWVVDCVGDCIMEDIYFIGGHPMAGSEKSGYINASPQLFKEAKYLLVPNKNVPESKVKELEGVIKTIGAHPIVMDAFSHDKWTAAVSHLPYVVSLCLSNSIDKIGYGDNALKISAGSLRDMTRISDSSINMWRDICITNKEEVINTLNIFKEQVELLTRILDEENIEAIEAFMSNARCFRRELARIKGY